MIDTIKKNDFLSKVQTVKMSKLETEVDAHDIAEGILVRVAEGEDPTSEQLASIKNIDCKLKALPVQLFANVTKSAVENNADTNKATYAENATISERLTALVREIHEDVIGESAIIINPKDYQEYLLEIAKDTATASILLNATAKSFLGYPIEVQNKIPQGTYLATPLKNLVFGMCIDIFRAREWNNRKRVIEYTFDISCDYEVVVKKWATICEQAQA